MIKASSNISSKPTLEEALGNVSKIFRSRIVKEYKDIKKRYAEALFDTEYDTVGISAGKLAETILRFLQHQLTGTYIPFGNHVSNFPDECRKLICLPKLNGVESLRIIIPRGLSFLYTVRGKRGIGHVGGDVEANKIDTETMVRVCDWMICELIRIFHDLSLEEAQSIVDTLSTKNFPEVWEVAGKKRVLRNDLSARQKTLLLAYTEIEAGVLLEDLFSWVEYSNMTIFKSKVLKTLHDQKFIEFDRDLDAIFISPKGILEVETKIINQKFT